MGLRRGDALAPFELAKLPDPPLLSLLGDGGKALAQSISFLSDCLIDERLFI